MSAESAARAGRVAAERNMTDTWIVERKTGRTMDSLGNYTDVFTEVYNGKARLRTYEAYESSPVSGGHAYAVTRAFLQTPVNDATAAIAVDDRARCIASVSDPSLVGTVLRIASLPSMTHATSRRFPVEEIVQ